MRNERPYSSPRAIGAESLARPAERASKWFWWRLAILAPISIVLASYSYKHLQKIAHPRQVDAAQTGDIDQADLRRSLRSQPLDAVALRQIALANGLETGAGAQLLQLAHRVSRRDLDTQLYLLELRAREGNFEESLKHYDALLSTRPAISPILLNVLARGLGDPDLRKALAKYAGRDWFINLIHRSAASDADPRAGLALARETGVISQPISRDLLAPALLAGLSAKGATSETAWLADQLGVKGWQDLGFNDATLNHRLGALAWRLEKTGAASAHRSGRDGIKISVAPLRTHIIARRDTLYDDGSYRLSFLSNAEVRSEARLDLKLTCPDLGRTVEIAIFVPSSTTASPGRVRLPIQIPSDCVRQSWALQVKGGDVSATEYIIVSALRLERL